MGTACGAWTPPYDPGAEGDAKPKRRGECLEKALDVINGERQDSYGNPEDSFGTIGEFLTTHLKAKGKLKPGEEITALDVAEMMALFKIGRMSGQKTTKDNYIDCAGYIGIAGDMVS
jgi:hypothetical protein